MTALQHEVYPKVLAALAHIAEGRTITAACDDVGISVSSFRFHVNDNPHLARAYTDAEQRGYDAMADALVTVDSNKVFGGERDPRLLKILSDNVKWFLARKRPKEYGDRVQVDVNITADRAITDALDRARVRSSRPALSANDADVIDVSPEDEYDDDEGIMQQLLSM